MRANVQLINGQWLAGQGPEFVSTNPGTGDILWTGNGASTAQVAEAVNSAREAFYLWSELSFAQRKAVINRFAEELGNTGEKLAIAIASETGRPLWETRAEISSMIAKAGISITAFEQRTGTTETMVAGSKAFIRHKPHGVVAVYGPYNFPGHLPNGHIIPALLAGNTVVFKPSEMTPLVAEITLQCWQQAGLPDGVINLVQGEVETGKALATHAGIDGLFFTGSSGTGHLLHQQFAGKPGKILALEMGGNNPLIVKQVANIDGAVHDIIQSAFVTTGQRCTCSRRLFIEKSANGDAILAKLISTAKNLKIGDAFAEDQPFMGSMISEKAALAMVEVQQQIQALGGKSLLTLQHLQPGTGFVSAGIIDVTAADALPDEEHFGPLVKVYRYENFADAIAEANNTAFGLSAGLLADDANDYQLFFKRIRAGIVNWNKPTTGASSAAPFGGIGASGNHRASAYYAADYCAYPVASLESAGVTLPEKLAPGLCIS